MLLAIGWMGARPGLDVYFHAPLFLQPLQFLDMGNNLFYFTKEGVSVDDYSHLRG